MFKPLFVQIGHHFPTSVRLDDFDFLRKNNETSLNVAMTIFSTARYMHIEIILRTTVSVKQKSFLATIKCPLFVFSSDIVNFSHQCYYVSLNLFCSYVRTFVNVPRNIKTSKRKLVALTILISFVLIINSH